MGIRAASTRIIPFDLSVTRYILHLLFFVFQCIKNPRARREFAKRIYNTVTTHFNGTLRFHGSTS